MRLVAARSSVFFTLERSNGEWNEELDSIAGEEGPPMNGR